ncbi:MAG: SusC/RagA family TonB-linked outer membrane protein [Bacteroidetes bacterium]|nr:MAG: SusC/RagA family TonB-linked outer membrane protein [Bacteroidota bacterium]
MRTFLRLCKILPVLLLLIPATVMAQERTVTGTVISEENKAPVSGATVRVKGTRKITKTDANGKFSIAIKEGETLQFSHVSFEAMEAKPGTGSTMGVTLKAAAGQLGEVVVTAMDVRKLPRELGYSAQKVTGAEIQESQRENFVNSLQGRVAGLTITPTTGAAGASSQIVLRGFNSLSLNNQPLFVVDGIIIDNQTINETSNGGSALGLASDRPNRNNDYTNRIADLNPNDIETVTVLKGPEATALYGSQAGSGAIIITTKKATTGTVRVNYDNSFRFQRLTRTLDLNDDYSPGTNGVPGGTTFSYFGPKYKEGTPTYDNIDAFFENGFSQTHNLSANYGFKNTGFGLSTSYFDQKAVIPTNDYNKFNIRLTNTTKIGKHIEISPSAQYIVSNNNKTIRSAGGYLQGLYTWPKDNDITKFEDENGYKIAAISTDPYTETDNPLYNALKNRSFDKTERYILSGGININPFDWLSVNGRFGYDHYDATGYTFYSPLSSLTSRTPITGLGALDNYWREYNGYNHTITATVKKKVGKWDGSLMVGTMWQDYKTEMFAVYGTGLVDSFGTTTKKLWKNGQVVTEDNFEQIVGSPSDSSITNPTTRRRLLRNNFGLTNYSQLRQLAMFGEARVGYDNKIYLSYTHRWESASVFPEEYRYYNYPGFSVSAIVTDILPGLKGKVINFWKLRGSRAQTAKLADPYKNQSVFVNNLTSSAVGLIYSYGFDNNNPYLQPERQKTYEFGMELKMLDGLLGFDISYYNTLCMDQITNQFRASYATGFILNTQNAGTNRNQGVEVVLDVNPIRRGDFRWNVKFNMAHMWGRVLTLPAALAFEYYIADTWLYGNARGGLIRGMPATTITGFHYRRNNQGKVVINPATGLPVVNGTFDVIGNRMPDFTMGTVSTLRYKTWTLAMNWDLRIGGDIFNANEMYLTLNGKSRKTDDREVPRVIDGVLEDGKENTANPTANTIVVIPYFQQTYYTSMPEEEFIQKDVNWLRLRDITLRYDLPPAKLKNMGYIKSLGFFVTGNDLLLFTNYKGADPAVNGNTASANGVGAFGFDYFSLPTPISLNFGLRVGF